jgi:hypothetical protein
MTPAWELTDVPPDASHTTRTRSWQAPATTLWYREQEDAPSGAGGQPDDDAPSTAELAHDQHTVTGVAVHARTPGHGSFAVSTNGGGSGGQAGTKVASLSIGGSDLGQAAGQIESSASVGAGSMTMR